MCMDFCPSECATAQQVASAVESVKINVLDDRRTRVGASLGGQTVVCCEGDTGCVQ